MSNDTHHTAAKGFASTTAGKVVILIVAIVIGTAAYFTVGALYFRKLEEPVTPLPIEGDTGVEVLPRQ